MPVVPMDVTADASCAVESGFVKKRRASRELERNEEMDVDDPESLETTCRSQANVKTTLRAPLHGECNINIANFIFDRRCTHRSPYVFLVELL